MAIRFPSTAPSKSPCRPERSETKPKDPSPLRCTASRGTLCRKKNGSFGFALSCSAQDDTVETKKTTSTEVVFFFNSLLPA